MDNKVQDDVDRIEVNEEVDIVFSTIRPFDNIEVDINGGNLDTDADIYFTGQTAGDIDQTIRRLKISVSVDDKLTSD